MRVPCCSVCQNKFDEEDRCPLLLQCGHSFCRECLSKMFTDSQDSSLSCPRCRHVSTVGNSVSALKKNYAVLFLIQGGEEEDDEDEDDEDESNGAAGHDDRAFITANNVYCGSSNGASGGGGCLYNNGSKRAEDGFRGMRIDLGVHKEVKMVRRIGGDGSGRRAGVELWSAALSGRGCKHKMAVKKVTIGADTDVVWMQGQLEELRRKSMWCRNVCTFHGAIRMDNSRCHGSVLIAMQWNEVRLTLAQILSGAHAMDADDLIAHECDVVIPYALRGVLKSSNNAVHL